MEAEKQRKPGDGAGLNPSHTALSLWAPCWWDMGHPCPHSDEKHEAQIFLSWWNRERIINIWRFYFIWNVVGWSPWKREWFWFSHYFIENVTSWEGRESESKHSASGEMYRKFRLKSELRSGVQNPKKPFSFLTEPPKNCPTYRNYHLRDQRRFPKACLRVGCDTVCQLCSVTLNLLKPVLKHIKVQNPHARQQGKLLKIISLLFSMKKNTYVSYGFGVTIHCSFPALSVFIMK